MLDIVIALATSVHINSGLEYNTLHPHLRIEYDNLAFGVFGNSVENSSFYAGINYQVTDSFSLEYGFSTGYEFNSIVPMIRSTLSLTDNINLFIIPSIEKINQTINPIVVLGAEYKF